MFQDFCLAAIVIELGLIAMILLLHFEKHERK